MIPLVEVLEHAYKVTTCHPRFRHPYVGNKCLKCDEAHTYITNKLSEALLDARERGFITWLPVCGWSLTAAGRQFYASLKGDYEWP